MSHNVTLIMDAPHSIYKNGIFNGAHARLVCSERVEFRVAGMSQIRYISTWSFDLLL